MANSDVFSESETRVRLLLSCGFYTLSKRVLTGTTYELKSLFGAGWGRGVGGSLVALGF